MSTSEIIRHRLVNQQIASTNFKQPQEIVSWMMAMQAQEYAMAKWAIGLRLPEIKDADVERAFNDGTILRTHVMRPTWHFVTPADIRWLIELTAPGVHAANAFMRRKMELDSKIFKRSNNTLIKALRGEKQLTRVALKSALERAKIFGDGVRISYLMMQAELDGIICSGAREGKQFTYALMDERVPGAKRLEREEALCKFAEGYFASRGPATVQDFATWSGLTMNDAKDAVASLDRRFVKEMMEGKEYILLPAATTFPKRLQTTFLMPDYDEYGMSYKDRSAIFNSENIHTISRENPVFNRMIILDGRIAGTWQRKIKGKTMTVETVPFKTLSKNKNREISKAIGRFRRFAGNSFE